MASVLKVQKANAIKAEGKGKRKADSIDVDEPPVQKKNKQRVLLLSSRGINHRMRHLMNDLEALLPHVKKGSLSQPDTLLNLTVYQTQNSTQKITSICFRSWQI